MGTRGLPPNRRSGPLWSPLGQFRYIRDVTYSIVARDPTTGELGAAVASCMFAVGSLVPWARAGVGAVATQAFGEIGYGPRCLDLLAAGVDPETALADVQTADGLSALRQVAVIDATGAVSSHTGDLCIDHAGHHVGDEYGVQANMMASDRVWPAMAETFEVSRGPLGPRMLSALRAAQDEGGDARGQMSAAMIVVDGTRRDEAWAGVMVDIRVDRHPAPLDMLAHLLDDATAYGAYGGAVEALIGGRPEDSLSLLDQALRALPGEANFEFLRAGALAGAGRGDEAAKTLRALLAANPSWATVVRSFAAKGLIALPGEMDIDEWLGNS
jgi:uncharacterized Ntn-hydrolase superfamily protein